jgi:arginine N-succinyltransferase
MARFEIRALLPGDEEQLHRVARHLNSVNLPNDRERIDEIVDTSYKSFAGIISAKAEREYVFVLFDRQEEKIIGTSMILAQLGRRGAPYIYFDVHRRGAVLGHDRQALSSHDLRIGYSYNGPTEIGGLVMTLRTAKSSERLGTMISYVRFLYMAAHRELFRTRWSPSSCRRWSPTGRATCGRRSGANSPT